MFIFSLFVAGTYVACLCSVVPTGLGGGSSHVIPTQVCALAWDLWLRPFFVVVLCAGDESTCLMSCVPTGLGGGSSHVITTLVRALDWDLWLRPFFVVVLCAGDDSTCLISCRPYRTWWRQQPCHPYAGLRVSLGSMAASFLRRRFMRRG